MELVNTKDANTVNNMANDVAAYNRILESKKKWARNHKDELRDYNRQYKLRKRLGGDVLKLTKEIEKKEADLVILRQLLTEANGAPQHQPQYKQLTLACDNKIETKGGDGNVLILIFSAHCRHSTSMLSWWNMSEKEIMQQYPDLKIIKMTCFDGKGEGFFSDRHDSFKRLLGWFPNIVLLKKSHWADVNSSINENNTTIFNGIISGHDISYKHSNNLSSQNLKDWLDFAYAYMARN
ncbi:Hypothetical protein HVR_LOCUS681 [uncultured virus]|nr:Hypothetical protein HVR_LOCUS681 [uncultured virus]